MKTKGEINSAPVKQQKHILIVEDNEMNVQLLHSILKFTGHSAHSVMNGMEAVNAALKREYDLILMDIQLPGINGVEAMKQIRDALKEETPPAIAITAYAMKGDGEKLIQKGFDDYLSKPFNINTLIEKINHLLLDIQ